MNDRQFVAKMIKQGTTAFLLLLLIEGLCNIIKWIFIMLFRVLKSIFLWVRIEKPRRYPVATMEYSAQYLPEVQRVPAGERLNALFREEQGVE